MKSKTTTYANVYPDGAVYHHKSLVKAWKDSDVELVGTIRIVIEDSQISQVETVSLLQGDQHG
tara:strand:- start:155 stop:343 length:189 start_codon:yes stop_codon:yes gene_type:complete